MYLTPNIRQIKNYINNYKVLVKDYMIKRYLVNKQYLIQQLKRSTELAKSVNKCTLLNRIKKVYNEALYIILEIKASEQFEDFHLSVMIQSEEDFIQTIEHVTKTINTSKIQTSLILPLQRGCTFYVFIRYSRSRW